MNSRQYIQIIKECVTCLNKEDVSDSIIEAMDSLRNIHKQFQEELDYYNVYPRHDLKKSEDIKSLIKDHCDEYGFKYTFTQFDSDWFKKGNFARYYLNEKEITGLIIFRKKDKNYPTKSIDDISFDDL